MLFSKIRIRSTLLAWFGFGLLAACAPDLPYQHRSQGNSTTTSIPPSKKPGSSTQKPASTDGTCEINFTSQLQMQLSAGDTVVVDEPKGSVQFYDIPPIPMIFENKGDQIAVSIEGNAFPQFSPYLGEGSEKLVIRANSATQGEGVFDSATGEMTLKGLQLQAQVFTGQTDLGTMDQLPPITLTTGAQTAHGNGNPNAISVEGAAYDSKKESDQLTLVTTMKIPDKTGAQGIVDTMIGGGALAAVFRGNLSEDPVQCLQKGGNSGGNTGGGTGNPTAGLNIREVGQSAWDLSKPFNFENSEVLIKKFQGADILDCSDESNRDTQVRYFEIYNTGKQPITLHQLTIQDTDQDKPDPQCDAFYPEFHGGALQPSPGGGVSCEVHETLGQKVYTTPCTLQPGEQNSLSFVVRYMPKNYSAPLNGVLVQDQGQISIDDGQSEPRILTLLGTTIKNSRDDFFLSFENANNIKVKVPNGGRLKFSHEKQKNNQLDPVLLSTQLNNRGTGDWTIQAVKLGQGNGSPFKTSNIVGQNIKAALNPNQPGTLALSVTFTPPKADKELYEDTLTIELKTAKGETTTLRFDLLGTVGFTPVQGIVNLRIDYMSAIIGESALLGRDPLASGDFRFYEEWGFNSRPGDAKLRFKDFNNVEIRDPQSPDKTPQDKAVTQLNKDQRGKRLYVYTATMTQDKDGNSLSDYKDYNPASGPSGHCNDPSDAEFQSTYLQGRCSYFFFNLLPTDKYQGVYDDSTGHLHLTQAQIRMENPFHGSAPGYEPSNPKSNPSRVIDEYLPISLTTGMLDKKSLAWGDEKLALVASNSISTSDLPVGGSVGKPTGGAECPGLDSADYDPFDHKKGADISQKLPNIKCFIQEGYLQGMPLTPRKESENEYDVVLVGLSRIPIDDDNLPFFMSGKLIWIMIQGVVQVAP